MNSPSSLTSRIHAAAHPNCCPDVAGVECDLIDRIKTAIEETSAHVCSYCAETLPVSLDEGVNLASARAHMAKCAKHPMRELVEALAKQHNVSFTLREQLAAQESALAPYLQPGEFHASADVEIPEER